MSVKDYDEYTAEWFEAILKNWSLGKPDRYHTFLPMLFDELDFTDGSWKNDERPSMHKQFYRSCGLTQDNMHIGVYYGRYIDDETNKPYGDSYWIYMESNGYDGIDEQWIEFDDATAALSYIGSLIKKFYEHGDLKQFHDEHRKGHVMFSDFFGSREYIAIDDPRIQRKGDELFIGDNFLMHADELDEPTELGRMEGVVVFSDKDCFDPHVIHVYESCYGVMLDRSLITRPRRQGFPVLGESPRPLTNGKGYDVITSYLAPHVVSCMNYVFIRQVAWELFMCVNDTINVDTWDECCTVCGSRLRKVRKPVLGGKSLAADVLYVCDTNTGCGAWFADQGWCAQPAEIKEVIQDYSDDRIAAAQSNEHQNAVTTEGQCNYLQVHAIEDEVIDLTCHTPEAAARELYLFIIREYGANQLTILSPQESKDRFHEECWIVLWEDQIPNWGLDLSIGAKVEGMPIKLWDAEYYVAEPRDYQDLRFWPVEEKEKV